MSQIYDVCRVGFTGGCPTLGCVFPPDQAEFLAGAKFDIRLEVRREFRLALGPIRSDLVLASPASCPQVHAPVNGSEAFNAGVPDSNFSLHISNSKGYTALVTDFFQTPDPALENWNFTWYEDLFAQDAKTPTAVNVASKAYRSLSLSEPGEYTATLKYWDQETGARWRVHEPCEKPMVKNVILFIGDGMPQSAVSWVVGSKFVSVKPRKLIRNVFGVARRSRRRGCSLINRSTGNINPR
jgi:hypothetical protein